MVDGEVHSSRLTRRRNVWLVSSVLLGVLATACLVWFGYAVRFAWLTRMAEREPVQITGDYDLTRTGDYHLTMMQWYRSSCQQSISIVGDPSLPPVVAKNIGITIEQLDELGHSTELFERQPFGLKLTQNTIASFAPPRESTVWLLMQVTQPLDVPGYRLESRYVLCGLETGAVVVSFVMTGLALLVTGGLFAFAFTRWRYHVRGARVA